VEYKTSEKLSAGTLYLIATPIGNLEDCSFRALDVLRKVDLIAAEDTRHAGILLQRYDIKKPVVSYYDENEIRRSQELLGKLMTGQSIALITDAGTPLMSDPGYQIVHKALDNDVPVVPIPGPSSILTALMASGLATDRFTFEGFLPRKKGRLTRLKELANEPRTMVFFESPHRIVKTLGEFREYFGDRPAVCAREMTKIFEEFRRDSLSNLIAYFETHLPKGEFVIVVSGAERKHVRQDKYSAESE